MPVKLKKFTALCLSCIIIFASMGISALAKQQNNLYVSFTKAENNSIIASVFIRKTENLDAVDFLLKVNKNSGAGFISLSAETADMNDKLSDIEDITDINTDEASFIYNHTLKADCVRFSGFFTSAHTTEKNLHLCDITIKTTADFSVNTPFSLSASLSYNDYEAKEKSVFFFDNAEQNDLSLSYTTFMGDVNNDGAVTANDARLILRHIVNLEDIPLESIPYADADYDGKITASDARYALRTAVSLEKIVSHQFIIIADEDTTCDKGGNFTFICGITGKTFRMKVDASPHIRATLFCTKTDKCTACATVISDNCTHSFDEAGICGSCYFDKEYFSDNSATLSSLVENIASYYQLAEEALSDDKLSDFIEYTQLLAKNLNTAATTTNNITGLEYTSLQLTAAYKLIFNAFYECMNDKGEISVSRGNCKIIEDSLKLSMRIFSLSDIENI